ncbi:DinB family protein [Arthrobacter sp. NPDC090010]|uniref:DinB family protein n=1 Tax=Arthrobacter sp. NPDC090010 TaxID=3363942 RepID=UPI0038185E51
MSSAINDSQEMRTGSPEPPPRETRDWSGVLETGCTECGFPAGELTPQETAHRLRDVMPGWEEALRSDDVRHRPMPTVWSPVEYACHVRDLCRLLPARLSMILSFDNPEYPDWDQDAAAQEHAYWTEEPLAIADDLSRWAAAAAAALEACSTAQGERTGRRSGGRTLTLNQLCATFLHEVHHHLRDAGGGRSGQSAQDRAEIIDLLQRFFSAFVPGPAVHRGAGILREALLPEAVIIRAGNGSTAVYGVAEFIEPRVELLSRGELLGFREWADSARIDLFGDIAQLWCGYAKSWSQDGLDHRGRGLKGIHCVRASTGWRISSIIWEDEREGLPIPLFPPLPRLDD